MKQFFYFTAFAAVILCSVPMIAQNQNLPNGYPTKPASTGNVQADEAAWIQLKEKWILEHPGEYEKVSGNKPSSNSASTGKDEVVIQELRPEFNIKHSYKIVSITAIPAPGKNVKFDVLQKETESIQKDLWAQGAFFQKGNNNEMRLFIPNKTDFRGVEKRSDKKLEWFFENKKCETCSKSMYLNVESENENGLVYILQAEDHDSDFAYKITFQTVKQ